MDILQLIEELEDVIDDASTVPFSKRVAIDPDEVFELIKEIRESLPEELRQAKWVNEERERIIKEADAQAQEIIQQAQKQASDSEAEIQRRFDALINEHSITKEATRMGETVVANAEKQAREIRQGIFAYVDEILANTQENLKDVLRELDNNRKELK